MDLNASHDAPNQPDSDMSETVQVRVRPSRAERTTTSCGECRRRKQKCNQGQPCSNCARRFPQPVCEYKANSKRLSPGRSQQPAFTVSLLPASLVDEDTFQFTGVQQPFLPFRQPPSPLLPTWSPETHQGPADYGEVVRWSGVDIMTHFPGSAQPPWNSPWTSAPGSLGPAGLPMCDANCNLHSDAIHDAVRLLAATHSAPFRFINNAWNPDKTEEVVTWLMNWNNLPSSPQPPSPGTTWPVPNSAQDLMYLPIPPTKENAELLRIFVKLLSRFKAALDGQPGDSNPYMKYFVPFCIQTPLLAQISIYTSACFLNETGHIDKTVAMAHKGQAIRMLNEHLRSSKSTSDEAIIGVLQLILDEWYWGETHDLRAHLRGLREMIRLRGGFRNLGMHGLLSKLAIVSDTAIALSFEVAPFLNNGPEFEFKEASQTPFRVSHNTPFISPLVPFSSCVEALDIHPTTASILDDMRFLISTVLSMPQSPTKIELQKLHTTSAWIYDRIANLPVHSPIVRRRPSASPLPSPGIEGPRLALQGLDMGSSNLTVPGRSSRSVSPRSPRSPHSPLSTSEAVEYGLSGQDDRSRHSPDASSQRSHSSTRRRPSPHSDDDPGPDSAPDFLYQAVRQAALIYSRAVMQRRPFSAVVSAPTFYQLWATMWHVPLVKWKALLGVFNWALACAMPSARHTPHDRFVKSMVNISIVQMGLDNWESTSAAMGAAVRFQAWLRGGSAAGSEEGEDATLVGTVGTESVTVGRRDSDASSGAEAAAAAAKGKGNEMEGGEAAAGMVHGTMVEETLPLHPRDW